MGTDRIAGASYDDYSRIPAFRFTVTIGKDEIGMHKVDGLENTTEVAEYREGNEVEVFHKMPGLTKTGNVTMERALMPKSAGSQATGWDYFKNWRKLVIDVESGNSEEGFRRKMKVCAYDRPVTFPYVNSTASATWSCLGCWPVKQQFSNLDATANEIAKETIELAVEHIIYT